MEHFAALVGALAWPVAAVWIGYIFRSEVRHLLSRMSHLKYKEVEARFDKGLIEAEAQAEVVQKAQGAVFPATETLSQLEQLRRIAEVSPRAAILEAWILVESAAMEAGLATGIVTQRVSATSVINLLARSERLPRSDLNLLNRLRQLRNQAAHLPDFALTSEEAERYLELAVISAEALRAAKISM